ncbi:MAG TPA: LuxR C-terminal-related transcriptional regulator [Rhodopila sp.]
MSCLTSTSVGNPGCGCCPLSSRSCRIRPGLVRRSSRNRSALRVSGIALRPFHRLPAQRRTREVLDLLAQGLSDTAIAAKSDVTSDTVRNHVAAIYKELGVNRRGTAVAWAREHGFGAKPKILTKLINPGAANGRSKFVQGTR